MPLRTSRANRSAHRKLLTVRLYRSRGDHGYDDLPRKFDRGSAGNNPLVWIEAVLRQPDDTWLRLTKSDADFRDGRCLGRPQHDRRRRAARRGRRTLWAVGFVDVRSRRRFGLVTQMPVNGCRCVWFALFERPNGRDLTMPFAAARVGRLPARTAASPRSTVNGSWRPSHLSRAPGERRHVPGELHISPRRPVRR